MGCPLIYCIDQTEGAEIWILDNESLPLVWKMQNNPLNVNWQVEHPSATYKDPIEVVVHRGANHLAPENTVASAYAALEHGATWIELDVRKSKDGVLYNLHDETLDRTTNGQGALADMNSDEVDKLDAGSWFGKNMPAHVSPHLGNARFALRKSKCILRCETRHARKRPRKTGPPERIRHEQFLLVRR